MNAKCVRMVLWAFLFFLVTSHRVYGSEYYADSVSGDDSNSGFLGAPWKTLGRINSKRFMPGDSVFLRCGGTWHEGLIMDSSGTSGDPITVGTYGSGEAPIVRSIVISGHNTAIEGLAVDADKAGVDAVRVQGSQNTILRGLTVRNGVKDGIDISGSKNVLIDGCHVHHFLAGSFNSQTDAHGIVVTGSQGITIRGTEIHQVSGDCFQADPNRNPQMLSNDIVIEGCHFWTAPLTEDFNSGWIKTDHLPENERQYPGENAVDTKVLKEGWESIPRMRITIRNVIAHGWRHDGFVANKAAFNLKEKIEAVLDGVTVYESEIAFRLRGNNGNANVLVKNGIIYDCEKAVRAEDDLANLKIYNCTFGGSIDTHLELAGSSGGTGSWDLKNNAFVGGKPGLFSDASNMVIPDADLSIHFLDPRAGDYHLRSGSSLVGSGQTLLEVSVDRDMEKRTAPYDVGAYEFSSQGIPQQPKTPLNLRILGTAP